MKHLNFFKIVLLIIIIFLFTNISQTILRTGRFLQHLGFWMVFAPLLIVLIKFVKEYSDKHGIYQLLLNIGFIIWAVSAIMFVIFG